MAVWQFVATLVISYAVTILTQPDVEKPSPAGLDDIDVNTAERGSPVPVIFGKPWIKSANCTWYGDLRTVAIKSKGGK
jgi:hypothetical protein